MTESFKISSNLKRSPVSHTHSKIASLAKFDINPTDRKKNIHQPLLFVCLFYRKWLRKILFATTFTVLYCLCIMQLGYSKQTLRSQSKIERMLGPKMRVSAKWRWWDIRKCATANISMNLNISRIWVHNTPEFAQCELLLNFSNSKYSICEFNGVFSLLLTQYAHNVAGSITKLIRSFYNVSILFGRSEKCPSSVDVTS